MATATTRAPPDPVDVDRGRGAGQARQGLRRVRGRRRPAAVQPAVHPQLRSRAANLRPQLVQVAPVAIVALGHGPGHRHRGHRPVGRLGDGAGRGAAAAVPRLRRLAARSAIALLAGAAVGAGQRLPRRVRPACSRSSPRSACSSPAAAWPSCSPTAGSPRLFDPTLAEPRQRVAARHPRQRPAVRSPSPPLPGSLVRRAAFGRRIVAIGGNRPAATLAGLPVRRTLHHRLRASAACSPPSPGVLATARLGASDPSFVGLLIELSAITAVVVGGTPLSGGRVRVLGTLTGALLMQLITATAHPAQPARLDRPDGPGRASSSPPSTSSADRSRDHDHRHTAGRRPRRAPPGGSSRGRRVRDRRWRPGAVAGRRRLSFGGSFAGGRNLGNIALRRLVPALIAIGMTFVIISGGIDLSVGSLFALGGVLAAYGARWGTLAAVAAAARRVRRVRRSSTAC